MKNNMILEVVTYERLEGLLNGNLMPTDTEREFIERFNVKIAFSNMDGIYADEPEFEFVCVINPKDTIAITEESWFILNEKEDILKLKEKTMKDKRVEEFKMAVQTVVDYLNKNGNPHDKIIVTQCSAEYVSGDIGLSFDSID